MVNAKGKMAVFAHRCHRANCQACRQAAREEWMAHLKGRVGSVLEGVQFVVFDVSTRDWEFNVHGRWLEEFCSIDLGNETRRAVGYISALNPQTGLPAGLHGRCPVPKLIDADDGLARIRTAMDLSPAAGRFVHTSTGWQRWTVQPEGKTKWVKAGDLSAGPEDDDGNGPEDDVGEEATKLHALIDAAEECGATVIWSDPPPSRGVSGPTPYIQFPRQFFKFRSHWAEDERLESVRLVLAKWLFWCERGVRDALTPKGCQPCHFRRGPEITFTLFPGPEPGPNGHHPPFT